MAKARRFAGIGAHMFDFCGVKRCAKFALVVKGYWLDKILAREKDWKIRSCSTARRGFIHFAQSKVNLTMHW